MTIDPTQLAADMAAGTPGTWTAKWNKWDDTEFIVQTEHRSNRVLATFDGDGEGPDNQSQADARRIAHLPELETAYLALTAHVAELEEALRCIASQKKTTELETELDVENADFEGGYDACIDRARAALAAKP